MIQFSVPLIFSDDFIEKIIKLNNEVKKSKITSVYNCFPANLENRSGFEQIRVYKYPKVNTEDDFFRYVKEAQDAGLEFIYLLNSPNSMTPLEFYVNSKNINRFIENLLSHNVKIVRISNTQLIDYITCNYPEIEIRTSTSQEYYSIRQYKNLFNQFPKITEIVPSWDLNKNFMFLNSFKKSFDKEIELMVNEGCLPGCPFRYNHNSGLLKNSEELEVISRIPTRFCVPFRLMCEKVYFSDPWLNIMLSNIIYPWEIETYVSKYNITKFKLVGRNAIGDELRNGKYFDIYDSYLKGIEDYDYIANMKFTKFNHYLCENISHPNFNLTVSEVKEYLPDITYFEKNGYKCMSICGTECRYCYSLAEKIGEVYPF